MPFIQLPGIHSKLFEEITIEKYIWSDTTRHPKWAEENREAFHHLRGDFLAQILRI